MFPESYGNTVDVLENMISQKSVKIRKEKSLQHYFGWHAHGQKSITRSLNLVLGRVLCLSRVGYF